MTDFPTIVSGESWSTGPGKASTLMNQITGAINALEAAALPIRAGTDPADASLNAGELTIWLDDTPPSPIVHLKGKDAYGTVFDVAAGGRLLVGDSPPVDVLHDPPVVDGWTWSSESGSWFSPAYAVSWQVGDNTGTVPYVAGAGTGAVQPSTLVGAGPFPSDLPAPGIPQFDWNPQSAPDGIVTTATIAGSGIIFLISQEEGFGGPTAPPRPDLNVLDYLGDLTLTNGTTPIPWALDRGTGADGDLYLQRSTWLLYGPRFDGIWSPGTAINSPTGELNVSAQSDVPVLTGYGSFHGVSDLVVLIDGTNRTGLRVTNSGAVITAGTEPADADLDTGQLACWYEPTTAAPVVHFKAKDAAGAGYVASLPMTPA